MITALIIHAPNNTGNIIFKGCKARFTIKIGMLTLQVIAHNVKSLFAPNIIAKSVTGTTAPIPPNIETPIHKKRLCSCELHHAINL